MGPDSRSNEIGEKVPEMVASEAVAPTPSGIRMLTVEGRCSVGAGELPDLLAGLSAADGPVIWIHAPLEPVVVKALDNMGLDEILVKSLRGGPERPRVEEFSDHVYISLVVPGLSDAGGCGRFDGVLSGPAADSVPRVADVPADESEATVCFRELRLFLGPRWLITVGELTVGDYDELAERMRRQVFMRDRGASFIAYHICEWLVEELQPLLEYLDDRIDLLEDEVVLSSGPTTIQILFGLKRELGELRRRFSPLRDVMQRLGSHGVPFVDSKVEVYFRDVRDDVMREIELLDTYRDILSSALDLHLSSVSMRLDQVMKQLTVVATIFMPLSFIVGLFGTNFIHMPFTSFSWFIIMFVLLGLSVVIMTIYTRMRA